MSQALKEPAKATKSFKAKMFDRYRGILRGLRRIFSHRRPTTTPSIVCERCHHQQSPRTTNDAVLASLMTLNAYLLAIFHDLEIQYWTIRSGGVNVMVCLLMGGTVLGFCGFGFWIIFIILPLAIGLWDLWWCMWGTLERIVNSFDENYVHMHGQGEGGETEEHLD